MNLIAYKTSQIDKTAQHTQLAPDLEIKDAHSHQGAPAWGRVAQFAVPLALDWLK